MLSPLQLQSIVDGECTPVERREWLALCDRCPEDWRALALALLEEQQFAKSLSRMQHEAEEPVDVMRQDSVGRALEATTDVAAVKQVAALERDRALTEWGAWSSLLAASLLLATGFVSSWMLTGWLGGEASLDNSNLAVAPREGTRAKELGPAAIDPARLGSENNRLVSNRPYRSDLPEADLRVQVPGVGREVQEIPIFDARDVDPRLVLAQQEYEVQKANQRLRRSGFELDMQSEYVTGVLPDGRQVVVPVHQVGLKPYGQ